MNESLVDRIGWFASLMAVAMFFSYIDQIRLNVAGHPGSVILPLVTALNGVAWIAYGALKPKRDWPIILPNVLAVVFGITTALTAVLAG